MNDYYEHEYEYEINLYTIGVEADITAKQYKNIVQSTEASKHFFTTGRKTGKN